MTPESEYQATLDYLYSFVDYSLQRNFRNSPEKFDLARMHTFLAELGNPQQHYPILHVAGTKGKGSVSALCASALRAAGYRVGFYTSPHLQDYAERIQINSQPISHAGLMALVEEFKPKIAAIPGLSTFEITTALAFSYFAQQKVDAAVIEVGLGGRLDATNIVLPVVSIITSLSYDHTYLLGDTLVAIAGEKAGIIKPGIPVVIAPQKDEARQVVASIAAERDAPLTQVGIDYLYQLQEHSLAGQSFRVWHTANPAQPAQLTIPLLGAHQVENAATAYAALQTTRPTLTKISERAIQEGFASVHWPGRFEILRDQPPVVVDSAHNGDSALRLRQALDDYFPGWPVVLVFGASEDKDIAGMFAELLPRVRQVILAKSFHPRAMDPDGLAALALPYGRPVTIMAEITDAFKEALHQAGDEALVLVAGSLFIAAGVRQAWLEYKLGETV